MPPLMQMPAYRIDNTELQTEPVVNALMQNRAYGLKQEQMGLERERTGMDRERLNMTRQTHEEARADALKKRIGGQALIALQEPDEAKRGAVLQSILSQHPEAAKLPDHYRNPNTGLLAIIGDAGMADKYLSYQLQRQQDARAAAAEERQAQLFPTQRETAQIELKAKREQLENPPQAIERVKDASGNETLVAVPKRGEGVAREVYKPVGGQPKLDSTTRRAVFEAQDELPNLKAAVDQLSEARDLLPQIYTGIGSGVRSYVNQAMPEGLPNVFSDPNRAKATQRYNQILGTESISAMSQTLKGATTDFELREFSRLMNDPNQRPETKRAALETMIRKAQSHYQNKVDRIGEYGGRVPNLGAATPSAPVRVNSPDEARKLPSGTPIILPDGSPGRVP